MKPWKKSIIVGAALLVFGGLRMPFEKGVTDDLHAANLLPLKMEISTRERIGQTSSAVALGGLRTLVATFLNLRAFDFFTEQRWSDVHDTYNTIVDLAPRTRYYWDTGSWHQAYNAASNYLYESKLSPVRRRIAWRESILTGREFLERGIRNNPDDWQLRQSLGYLLQDANKIAAFGSPPEAYAASAAAYQAAVDTGRARDFTRRAVFYSLARVPGREAEALEMARKIRADLGDHPLPTVLGLLYTLEFHADPDQPVTPLLLRTFSSAEQAYDILSNQWLRTREHFPVHGIAQAITELERRLEIPAEESALNEKALPPMNPDDWFRPAEESTEGE